MIEELTVQNLAIIEFAQIALGPGFTVLTGETGAGKSLLVDAIELALGERADTELVRSGARSASVHVVLDLSGRDDLVQAVTLLGFMLEDGKLFLDREVLAEGRSQCRINGKLTPVSQLKQLGHLLVDLHGQHDHQSLLDPERHIGFLDAWIGAPAEEAKATVAHAFADAEDLRKRLAALRTGQRDREQRLDLLRYQLNEIESANPQPSEMAELEAEISRLKNVERLAGAAAAALTSIADGETSSIDLAGSAAKTLEDAVRLDPGLEETTNLVNEALYRLQEAGHALRGYLEELEADPERLEEIAGRIDLLKRLRRKYGDDEQQILDFLHQARLELDSLEGDETSEEELTAAHEQARATLARAAAELTALRQGKARDFAAIIQEQLRELAMERALFEVAFREKEPAADGGDEVEFYFSANAGEPPRPLSKIASGGEISRVMLAIKTGLAGRAGVPTLIFDEVDAGLGGRAAATVAHKLEELSQHYQVLVISHLPQIASRARCHFRIEKTEKNGRVATDVRRLSDEERIEEIARMVAGDQLTDAALANAREMLAGSA